MGLPRRGLTPEGRQKSPMLRLPRVTDQLPLTGGASDRSRPWIESLFRGGLRRFSSLEHGVPALASQLTWDPEPGVDLHASNGLLGYRDAVALLKLLGGQRWTKIRV